MNDFIIIHDSASLGSEMMLNRSACKMVCKILQTGKALIRISSDPRMPGIACTESYDEVKKMLGGYVQTDQK